MSDVSPFFVATLSEQVLPKISDQIIKFNVLLKYFKGKKVLSFKKGGADIKFRVRSSKSTEVGATNDWTQRTAKTTNPFETLTTNWRSYDGNILLSKFQDIRNRNASGVAKMFDSEMEQVKERYQAFQERIGNHIYGDGTVLDIDDIATPPDGLQNIISATNTYCGVNRSSSAKSWWRAQIGVDEAGNTGVSNFTLDDNGDGVCNGVAAMQNLFNLCSVGMQPGDKTADSLATAREMPDLTITTQTIYQQYEKSLMGQYRYTTDKAVDALAESLLFHQKPIEWDTFCPAGKLFMLNFAHWFMWTTSPDNSLIELIGEETQGKTKILTIGIAGLQQWTDKSSSQGVLAVT